MYKYITLTPFRNVFFRKEAFFRYFFSFFSHPLIEIFFFILSPY